MNTAAKVAQAKECRPEVYCPEPRCLWRTGGGRCPRHIAPAKVAPILKSCSEVAAEETADVSTITCAHCPATLEFVVTDDEEAAMAENGWEYKLDGPTCGKCAPNVVYVAVM